MTKSTPDWTGVIVVGPFELDCRLFGATSRVKQLPLKMVHTECKTILEEKIDDGTEKKEKSESKITAPTQAREQIFCPKCQIPLRADQIGRAVETEVGTILLLETEIEYLNFKPQKRVTAELIAKDDPVLAVIGIRRRFYVMPKPAAVKTWYQVFHMLKESQKVGFVNPIIIKRKPYIGILRPLVIPEIIFGKERSVLVFDLLNDAETLKDPALIPDYPKTLPPLNMADLAKSIVEALGVKTRLDPERCTNPMRARLKEIIRKAIERSLIKK